MLYFLFWLKTPDSGPGPRKPDRFSKPTTRSQQRPSKHDDRGSVLVFPDLAIFNYVRTSGLRLTII
jgi:hypothetical protein